MARWRDRRRQKQTARSAGVRIKTKNQPNVDQITGNKIPKSFVFARGKLPGPMGVTHFLMLSNPKSVPHLRVARTPQGPTLTFQIQEYSLASDIAKSQPKYRSTPELFKNSPLIVLSGFGRGAQHLKLATIMFQNIFPAIDINTVKDPDVEGRTVYDACVAANKGILIERLARADSDFSAFIHHAGIPSLDMYYGEGQRIGWNRA